MMSIPTLTIKATKRFGSLGLGELWEYRNLLRFQILRELKGKYHQMPLGPIWIVLRPVINMIVFCFVFGKVAKMPSDGTPHTVLTYTALIPWTFFANASNLTVTSLVADMHARNCMEKATTLE